LFRWLSFPLLPSRFKLYIIIDFNLILNKTYWQMMPQGFNLVKCVPRILKMR
jgi:hypothetical protein